MFDLALRLHTSFAAEKRLAEANSRIAEATQAVNARLDAQKEELDRRIAEATQAVNARLEERRRRERAENRKRKADDAFDTDTEHESVRIVTVCIDKPVPQQAPPMCPPVIPPSGFRDLLNPDW